MPPPSSLSSSHSGRIVPQPMWQFHSFNPGRFHQVFGKASDTEEMALLKVIEFELGSGPEDELGQIAKQIAKSGISYQGLNPRLAEGLDSVLVTAFGPDGLWTELELENESAGPLPPKLVEELLKRAASASLQLDLLPALKKGRRYGVVDQQAECNYVIFDRNEVVRLAQEVKQVIELPAPWSSPTAEDEARDGLLMVAEYVARKRKALAGVKI